MELENQQALDTDYQGPLNPDLLFAWLSPIEKKVDNRLRTKSTSPAVNVTHSPFLRAFRRTFRTSSTSGGVPVGLRARGHTHKLRGVFAIHVHAVIGMPTMSTMLKSKQAVDLSTPLTAVVCRLASNFDKQLACLLLPSTVAL